MKRLSPAMMQRLLPTTVPIDGTLTRCRSVFLKLLRQVHGAPCWEPLYFDAQGPCRCVQCGGPKNPNAGRRCGNCYRDNALCKVLKPGPLGQVICVLLAGEAAGRWRMEPYGVWTAGRTS